MIKLRNILIESLNIKWILGYIDSYDKVHFKVVLSGDPVNSHNQIWPGPKQRKWRWIPTAAWDLNTYGDELDPEAEDRIWRIIDKYKKS